MEVGGGQNAVDDEVVTTMSALIRRERPFEREAVARFFDEQGWMLVSSYPFPREWEFKGVGAYYRPGETDTGISIDFILYEHHSDWGPSDEELVDLGLVLADVAGQLVAGLSETLPVTEVPEAAGQEAEFIDVRCFQVGSLLMRTAIYVGDGVLPTMIIAQLAEGNPDRTS